MSELLYCPVLCGTVCTVRYYVVLCCYVVLKVVLLCISVSVSVALSHSRSVSYLHDRLVAQARAFFGGLYQVISPELLGELFSDCGRLIDRQRGREAAGGRKRWKLGEGREEGVERGIAVSTLHVSVYYCCVYHFHPRLHGDVPRVVTMSRLQACSAHRSCKCSSLER